jgi:hypothetical protein
MNFVIHRNETRDRFNEVLQLLNHISTLEPTSPLVPATIETKIMRGLFYVHLYAAFEKSINDLVSSILLSISSFNVLHFHFTPQFNIIAARNILISFKDTSYKNYIPKGIELIEKLICRDVANFNETAFLKELQNVWYKTVMEVRNAFGMPTRPQESRVSTTVDEIVNNRNAIAHGRLSPVLVGSSQGSIILRQKMTILQNFNDSIVDEFEAYFLAKKFIKPTVRRLY